MDYILGTESFEEAQRFYEDNHISDFAKNAFDIETERLVDSDYKHFRLAQDEFEELTDKLDSAKGDAEMAREDMHAERELAQKLQAWKESAKQEHLAAGTWVSQAREEELNDKIKSLESTLQDERTMTEHGYLRGSSTGDCIWYRNLEALRKDRDGWERAESRMREENEKLKKEIDNLNENLNDHYEKCEENEELKDEIERLKEKSENYFQAWLHYWSAGQLGEEGQIPLSQIEDGKYQKLLDALEEDE